MSKLSPFVGDGSVVESGSRCGGGEEGGSGKRVMAGSMIFGIWTGDFQTSSIVSARAEDPNQMYLPSTPTRTSMPG
eukprot:3936729-Rhodomonas_salina.1